MKNTRCRSPMGALTLCDFIRLDVLHVIRKFFV